MTKKKTKKKPTICEMCSDLPMEYQVTKVHDCEGEPGLSKPKNFCNPCLRQILLFEFIETVASGAAMDVFDMKGNENEK